MEQRRRTRCRSRVLDVGDWIPGGRPIPRRGRRPDDEGRRVAIRAAVACCDRAQLVAGEGNDSLQMVKLCSLRKEHHPPGSAGLRERRASVRPLAYCVGKCEARKEQFASAGASILRVTQFRSFCHASENIGGVVFQAWQ